MALDDIRESDDYAISASQKAQFRKKALTILALFVVLFAFAFALHQTIYKQKQLDNLPYKVIEDTQEEGGVEHVYYTLPEMTIALQSQDLQEGEYTLEFQAAFEFVDPSQIETFETLSPKVQDVMIFMLTNLRPSEISTAKGMYWLKEEILHRSNMLLSPLHIESVSFKQFKIKGGHYSNDATDKDQTDDR